MSVQKYDRDTVAMWAEYRDVDGMTYPEIEKMLNLPRGTVAWYIKHFGFTQRKNTRHDYTAIIALHDIGYNNRQIQRELGIKSTRTVVMALESFGKKSNAKRGGSRNDL